MSVAAGEGLATRDRLLDFVALRKAARRQDEWMLGTAGQTRGVVARSESDSADGSAATFSGCSSAPVVKPPPWIRALQSFATLEATVEQRMAALSERQQEFFAPRFLGGSAARGFGMNDDGDDDDTLFQAELDQAAHDIQKLLKELERMVLSGVRPADANNADECCAAQNVQKHLTSRLTKLMGTFRDGQQWFVDQLKKRKDKVKKFQRFAQDEQVHDRLKEEEKIATYMELGYTQADIQELLVEERRQQEVCDEVQNILESIKELQEMFKDLSSMVVEQGTVLDRVDYNIMKSSENINKGLDELKKAREHQKRCSIQ